MKVVIITNIPVPYRLPIYEKINRDQTIDLTVFFCAKNESNRLWNLELPKFKHLFLKENVKAKKDGFNFVYNNIDVWLELKKIDPDVVITTGFNPTHLYAWFYTKLYNKKHIPMTDGWIGSEKKLSFIHKLVRKVVFKTSNAFIGASKNSLELYKSYGIVEEKLFQSHLCIDNKYFDNQQSFLDRKYDLMFSGHLSERKLPFLFTKIAEKVSKKISDLNILILGDGPLKKGFLEQLDKTAINYHYAGFVSQEELPAYYSSAKIFLFTTQHDAWGIVVNEAMASGTPVITTPFAGVINDLLIDKTNGYILDIDSDLWAEKSIDILNDSTLWEELSQNAKKSVKAFNFDDAAQGIIDACEYASAK